MTVQGTCRVIAMPTLSGRIALGEPEIRLGYMQHSVAQQLLLLVGWKSSLYIRIASGK